MTEAELSDEKLAELIKRHSPRDVPKCHICGEPMTIGTIGMGRISYGCYGRDEQGNLRPGRTSVADEHAVRSRREEALLEDHEIVSALTELQRHRAAQAARKAQTDADAFGGTSGHVADAELLACPFCGGTADYFANGSVRHPDIIVHRVACNCELQPFTGWRATKDEAIAAWNRRTPDIARGEGAGDWVLVPREPTPEMIEVALVEAGWKTEPYRAPRESGVPTESDISQADADSINAAGREAMASTYRVMILRAAPCTFCANGNELPDGEQCQCCGRIGDLPPGADAPNRDGGGA